MIPKAHLYNELLSPKIICKTYSPKGNDSPTFDIMTTITGAKILKSCMWFFLLSRLYIARQGKI